MWEKKHEIFRRHSPFSSLDGTRSIYLGQCGGILLPWPPGSYPPFFCIYSTLIFLWETLPPWLLEYLFHMVLTLLWALAKQASRIISRISTWFTKSQWEPRGFCSNSWPQVIFPMRRKRPSENGASLKENKVERCRRPGLQTCEPQTKLRTSLGFPAMDQSKFPFRLSNLD